MASYFGKYQGRGGPAIAPGIVQMMGSIGDEYAKGITALGEGVAEYQKNKAEKGRAEADFENALSRMDSLYGEEPGDYQQVLNAVDSKTMEKIQKGKGTKEDFLSALNSLNTVGESIEDRREDAESARRFGITSGIQQKQLEATERIAGNRLTHAASEGGKDRKARADEGTASRTHSAAEGKADRGSRKDLQKSQITSTEGMHGKGLDQAAKQFKESSNQEFYLRMREFGLRGEALDQQLIIHEDTQNLAIDKMAQQRRQFDDTLKETKRVNQVTLDKVEQEKNRAKAGQVALSTYTDKTQTEFDADAHSAAMSGANSLSGPTPDQLQSYMDNPEQFQRQLTPSERAVKALQTPGISPEVQDRIATMANANADAGTGGVKFVKHPVTGEYVMAVGPRGSMSQLPSSRKTVGEMQIEARKAQNKIKAVRDDQKGLDSLKEGRMKQIGELRAAGISPEEEEYKAVITGWDALITEREQRLGVKPVLRFDKHGNPK